MILRADWIAHLHEFRKRELETIFGSCSDKFFNSALELGAGECFQSRLLIAYTERLVATDYNDARLQRVNIPGITYHVCDAEKVDEQFAEKEFDLVFASNLFEHLPDPHRALLGISHVLSDDGVVILVMPSVFWKVSHLIFFYPNLILSFFEKVTIPGKLSEWLRRYVLRREEHTLLTSSNASASGNNPKGRKASFRSKGIFHPLPHGVSSSNIEELFAFRTARWVRECESAGFSLCNLRPGPVASGYGFGLDRVRTMLEWLGFASEYIYILKKRDSITVKYPFK